LNAAEPFSIQIAADVLGRIVERVRDFRWPAEPVGSHWQYGVPTAFMRTVQAHWLERFDWGKVQARLNEAPHYRASMADGQRIHFVHKRSQNPDAIPILLLHGWPGSFLEYLDLIEPLADEAGQAFHVVVASLPGYGFSDPAPAPVTPREVASMMNELMTGVLNYERYMVHGGDWGSIVAGWLALDHSSHCRALHWTMMGLSPGGDAPGFTVATIAAPTSDEEMEWAGRCQAAAVWEFGYAGIQATKPLTLSYAMMDSPMGVAAWILEKFQGWTDSRGRDVTELVELDTLLTNVMIYLVTDSFGPASWMYRSLMTEGNALPAGRRIEVPIGLAVPAHDVIPPPPRSYVEKIGQLVHWTQVERGGHFLALENPRALIDDLRLFAGRVHSEFNQLKAEG